MIIRNIKKVVLILFKDTKRSPLGNNPIYMRKMLKTSDAAALRLCERIPTGETLNKNVGEAFDFALSFRDMKRTEKGKKPIALRSVVKLSIFTVLFERHRRTLGKSLSVGNVRRPSFFHFVQRY